MIALISALALATVICAAFAYALNREPLIEDEEE